jgi:cell division protein FtsI/penicillin-binding protein 2
MNADSPDRNHALNPRRVILFYMLVLVSVAGLVVRLVDLQVLKRDHYRQQAQAQSKGHVYVRFKRGEILDRNLRELAVSVESGSVGSHAGQVRDPGKAAKALAPFLPLSREEIQETLVSNTGFTYLARKIPPHQVTTINALKLKGIQVDWDMKRTYPQWELAAHVLGFVGVENEGLGGVEYLYDGVMRGETTRVNLKVDGRRHVYNRESSGTGSGGNIVVLNLDESIQYSVEQILGDTVREFKAASGSAIVMDVHTGEILALASHPTYNPNDYTSYGPEEKRNRAILDIYEPGSTFKLVTLSAALEEGLVQSGELVDCRVGTVRLGRKVYREAKRSYGTLSFEEILAKSSNVGTIKMGLRLGEERFYSYIRGFGFGNKTGIELPGEQVGLLVPPERWSRISIGALSIGQELGVTPIQMVRAFAVFGNGGYLVKPRLVRHTLSEDGRILEESRVERERVLSAETVRTIKNAMGMVVERGTGRRAQPAGYSAGGKTGTAQKFVDGSYSRTRFVASFGGIAPLSDPVVAALVVIDEPRVHHYGGIVAAPAFRRIMERALVSLQVPQDRRLPQQDRLLARQKKKRPRRPVDLTASAAEEPLTRDGLAAELSSLIGDGNPDADGGRSVTVATGTFPLPDLSGLSLREALRKAGSLSLRLRVTGSGVVVAQHPAPGTPVFPESMCQVHLDSMESSIYETQQLALGRRSQGVRESRH